MLLSKRAFGASLWAGVQRARNRIGAVCFALIPLLSPGQQLLDDFNRPDNTAVGGFWTEGGASGGVILTNQLRMTAPTAANGREWIMMADSSYYQTAGGLSSNTCMLTWAFNLRFSRSDPSGFDASNYGAAVILGSTDANPTLGQGYAVVIGNSSTPDPVRLVRFNGGVDANANLTNIVTRAITDAQYLGVRVTFTPSTNTWEMFVTNNAGPFTSPLTGGTSSGTAVNNTYTGAGFNLVYTGVVYNHATSTTESLLFDNYYIPQRCTPTVNFTSTSASTLENIGAAIPVNLSIFPASVTGGDIVIGMVNGAGVTYGVDYTVSGAGVVVAGSTITITVAAGATSASFNINLIDDAADEGNETVTFVINSTTGDLVLGSSLIYTQTIVDNDGLPQVNFTTTSVSVLETNTGPHSFNLSISPTVASVITVQITATNSLGTNYDYPPWDGVNGDYYTVPAQTAGVFNVTIPASAAGVSFTASIWDDLWIDTSIETVTFTITGVSAGASIGTSNTSLFNISDNEAFPTTLTAGDLAIVGVNSNNGACSGNPTEDIISFFCFKPITYGTKIIITDNGYARCSAGTWGNNEGTVELTRTGTNIPAGQVITWRITGTAGSGNVVGLGPDAGWTCASLNGFTSLNMNAGGDQIFFMQGGAWTTGTVGSHNATYTGTVLYGFSTGNNWNPFGGSCTATGITPSGNNFSQLPIGMNCFSMAPTSSSDFNKFTGSRAAKTQRDWMIAIDSPTQWSSLASCATYTSTAPNWLTEPPLPILVGGFTPGLWRGTTNTDWFECKNWDDVTVPVSTTNVRIDETATNHCVVGVTAGGTAVCASLVQTNSGTARDLTIQNGSSLAVGGPITVQRTSVGSGIRLTVSNTGGASTLTGTDFTVQGMTAGSADASLWNTAPTNTVLFSGNFSIGIGGYMNLYGTPTTGGRISIGGNYSNAGPTETTVNELNGTIAFNGTGNQTISTSGFQDVFWEMVLTKASGSVTLNNPLAVRDTIFFNTGVLNTSLTPGLLTMRAGSGWRNATDASFVNGPMEKIGNTDFTFPVGKGTILRPAGLLGITGAATNAFRAEYFPSSAWTFGTAREATVHHVSDCEYWLIDRTVGSPNAVVELSWRSPYSCGVSDLSDLIVARWDSDALPAPGIWRDRGNGGAAGTFANGTIPTAAVQTLFNTSGTTPWTLASTTTDNPLPITLVEFTAKPEGSAVRLNWSTASEFENALFTVERSQYGLDFEPVLDVPGAMFSSVLLNYTDLDRAPYSGLSYYRLRQTDVGGTLTYSPVVAVRFGGLSGRPLVVFGRAGTVVAVHDFNAGSRFDLLDMTGRIIATGNSTADGRTELNGSELSPGAYVFRVTDGERTETQRFVY
ncbi:MAG: T9SS type A sorting domain-containing protein [Flavobacteriales bacterium]|nr:T9SS type A sorting domain-containing protein [Flavobacteriales bacterium]